MAVAVVMLGSFLWIAMNFGTSRSGYSSYGSDDYTRKKRSSWAYDNSAILSNLLGSYHKYQENEEDDLNQIDDSENVAEDLLAMGECGYLDACRAGQDKNHKSLQTLSFVLRLLQSSESSLSQVPGLSPVMSAFLLGQSGGDCEKYKTGRSC